MLRAGETVVFHPVCDEIEHVGVRAGDILALVRPAWFLAKTAVERFPSTLKLPGAQLTDLKKLLERSADALELQLAFVANKSEGTAVDGFQFRDVCHLAQTVWFATGIFEPVVTDIAVLRERLAAASVELSQDFAKRDRLAGIDFVPTMIWGAAAGLIGFWWYRRRKRLSS